MYKLYIPTSILKEISKNKHGLKTMDFFKTIIQQKTHAIYINKLQLFTFIFALNDDGFETLHASKAFQVFVDYQLKQMNHFFF